MDQSGEIPVVYQNGVLRPDTPLNLPERTRLMAQLRPVERSRESADAFIARLETLRQAAGVQTCGWRFDRDRIYDRT